VKVGRRVGSRARIITSSRAGWLLRFASGCSHVQRILSNGDCRLSAMRRREWSDGKRGDGCMVKFQAACVTVDRFRIAVARYVVRDGARNPHQACGTMLLVGGRAALSLWAA